MENTPSTSCQCDSPAAGVADDRRGFLAQALALVFGTVSLLVPAVVGIVAYLYPLRQKGQAGEFPLASMDDLPEDGTPRKFPVIADRTDAWNMFPNEPIGAVFLRRNPEEPEGVEARQVICPHAGCTVVYQESAEGGKFFCPCHRASFDLSGNPLEKPSPSPRPLDKLSVRVVNSKVLVIFQNFETGTSKQVPKA